MQKQQPFYLAYTRYLPIIRILWLPILLILLSIQLLWLSYDSDSAQRLIQETHDQQRQHHLMQLRTAWQHRQQWQQVDDRTLMIYQGLLTSGQWQKQDRLAWLTGIESLSLPQIQPIRLTFSEQRPWTPSRVIGLSDAPFTLHSETFTAEVLARHEWHALDWIDHLDAHLFPTGLLQSCELHLPSTEPIEPTSLTSFAGVRTLCRWLLLDITPTSKE